jgi:hypothetical protein
MSSHENYFGMFLTCTLARLNILLDHSGIEA